MDIGGVEHTAFVVRVGVPRDHFAKGRHEVARRYSEFERLHEALTKAWGKQARRAPRTGGGVGAGRGEVRGRTSSPPPKRPSDCHSLMPTAPHARRSEALWSCPSCRPSGSTGSGAP